LAAATIRLSGALDIDTRNPNGNSLIMCAAIRGNYDAVDYFARMKADLSITNSDNGNNVYSATKAGKSSSQEEKDEVYRVLKEHSVTGPNIMEGYRSPLSIPNNFELPPPLKLAQEVPK
jgi:hypothetical protein